jgi:APA family basic amino acid/polyamine antiporter
MTLFRSKSLYRTKSIDALLAQQREGTGLKRVLGPVNLVLLGIGAIIGTGIFVLTGQAAAMNAGPAIVISMLIAGFASALAGLCYAELASTVPVAGSAYTYAIATLGEFVAWIIGWDLILEYALGAATVAVGWSGNVVSLLGDFGIALPAAISGGPGSFINLPAVVISILVTWLLVRGVQESAMVNAGDCDREGRHHPAGDRRRRAVRERRALHPVHSPEYRNFW